MTCHIFNQSAVGIALDLLPYCHRPECRNWKDELQKFRSFRHTRDHGTLPQRVLATAILKTWAQVSEESRVRP